MLQSNLEWQRTTTQKLVRYEALFNLIDEIQRLDDFYAISKIVTRQWKYFANVAGWRLTVLKDKGGLIIDGYRGDVWINDVKELSAWDAHHEDMPHPRLIHLLDPWQGPPAPEHLTGKNICDICVQRFLSMEQPIALLSVGSLHEPFSELDNKFIRIFGHHLADRFSGMVFRQAAMDKLKERATKDGLTGLLNRAEIFEQFSSRYEISARTGQPISVVLLDIDFFKVINDSHGHLCGDQVLKELSRRIKLQTRTGDQLGRYGGEEFLAVLFPCDEIQVKRVAERFRRSIADELFDITSADTLKIKVTISLGASTTYAKNGIRMEQLLKQADDALYISKVNGRDRVTCSHDLLSSAGG